MSSKLLPVGLILEGSHSDDAETLRDPATIVAEVAVDALEAVRDMDTLADCPPAGNRRPNESRATSVSLVHLC